MKKQILYILSALALVISCKSNQKQDSGIPSGVSIKLSLKNSLTSDTKGLVDDDYPMTSKLFKAEIIQNDEVLLSWDTLSKIPEILYLNPGNYVIRLRTNGTRNVVNTIPLYEGETAFSVEPDKVSSIYAEAVIQSMAVSVTLTEDLTKLTGVKITYYNIEKPDSPLLASALQTGQIKSPKAYIDQPFPLGIRIEGRMDGIRWSKNILIFNEDMLQKQTFHNIIVK